MADLDPLEGPGVQATGLDPLEGPGAQPVPLEADAALGLRTLSPASAAQRSRFGYAGIPGSEIDTTTMVRDPFSGIPLYTDDEADTQEVPDAVSESLRLASKNSSSSATEEARKALILSRDLNLGPGVITGRVKEYEQIKSEMATEQKLRSLPSYRLQWWMSQTPARAAAIAKELDQWGTLDYIFGRYVDAEPGSSIADTINKKGRPSWDPSIDRELAARHNTMGPWDQYGQYQRPGWYQALGRAVYAHTTSMQTWFEKNYVGLDTEATKFDASAGGPSRDEIEERRVAAHFPVPGDTIYAQDGEGKTRPAGKEHPVLGTVNSVLGMAPLIATTMAHPLAGAAMIWTETAGRTYEDMRLEGWGHEEASGVSELTGFTMGAIAVASGGMFKYSFLPKGSIGALSVLPNAVGASISKNPTFWRAAMDLGKNFVASTVMNMTMASSEVAIKEAFDASRQGRPYDHSKVAWAAYDASKAWAEMLALSVVPAYEAHKSRVLNKQVQEFKTQDEADRARAAEAIYNNYEERGQALRSMHEATRIVSAAEALSGSEFAATNPGDARDLVNMLVAPRGSQTVYLRPEAVAKLPPDMLEALGHPDQSLGSDDGKIPVNLTDLILHPDGAALARQAAGEPDLRSASELGSVDFSKSSGGDESHVPDEQLAEYLAQERERRRGTSTSRLPTEQEIRSAVQGAVDQDEYAPRSKEGAMPPTDFETGGQRRPPPDLGPKKRPQDPAVSMPPLTEAAARRWAIDAVSRVPTGELEALGRSHEQRAADAAREATEARKRTEDGRFPTAKAMEKAEAAERRAMVSGALTKAAREAFEEVRGHTEYLAAQASDDPLPGGQMKPREAAYAAGEEFGTAHDAIMEALGLSKVRGNAAPDLSDIYDKLARLNKLSRDGFDGWDLTRTNELLRDKPSPPEMALADMREIVGALKQISQAADAENSVRVFGIQVAKAMMVRDISEHLQNIPDVPPGQRMMADNPRALSGAEDVDKGRGSIAASLNKPSTLLLKLGKVGESLYFESLVPGIARENRMWGDVLPVLQGIDREVPPDIRKLGKDKIRFPDGEKHLRSDVWDMVAKLGTKDADSKIARSMGFRDIYAKGSVQTTAEQQLWDWVHRNMASTPEQAKTIMEKLVSPHWKVFENQLWPEYARMFKERGLAPPEKLKPRKMTIFGNEYQGSYGGRLKWWNESGNQPVVHPGSLEALLDSDVTGPTTQHRQLLERDPDFLGKPLFSWDGLVSDIRKEIHDIALRPFVEDAHKVFSDSEVRKLIGNKLGQAALDEMYDPNGKTSFLHTVARGSVADVHSAKAWSQMLFKFQGLAAYSAFSLNTRVMLGQLSHIPAAMAGLGLNPIHAGEAVAAAFNPERRAWAHAYSETLRLRYANYEDRAIELTRQLTGLEPGRDALRRGTDHLNWMAWREMDAFLSHAIWEAAYSKAVGKYQVGGEVLGHDAAVRQADIAVTRMMPAQDIYDQSSFVRDRSIAGFSYMVRNFPNTLANVAALNWWTARLQGPATSWKGAAARAKASAQFVGMVMAAEILGKGFIMQGGPRDRDDPEHWYTARLFGAMSYPYMISEPAIALFEAASGDRHAARQELDRMMPASIGVVAQGIDDVGRFFQNGDEEALLRAAAHLSGLLLRSPLPGKLYDISNAGRNAEDPADAAMKAMGYRR